jgi:hypothetical protein
MNLLSESGFTGFSGFSGFSGWALWFDLGFILKIRQILIQTTRSEEKTKGPSVLNKITRI